MFLPGFLSTTNEKLLFRPYFHDFLKLPHEKQFKMLEEEMSSFANNGLFAILLSPILHINHLNCSSPFGITVSSFFTESSFRIFPKAQQEQIRNHIKGIIEAEKDHSVINSLIKIAALYGIQRPSCLCKKPSIPTQKDPFQPLQLPPSFMETHLLSPNERDLVT